jgi:short-subunit dehydrogenase
VRNLAGKRALVTGAASGIGRAIALEFARAGTNLVLIDIDESGLTNVVAEARQGAVDATAIKCDVAQVEQLRSVVDQLIARWRGVDILVNNAGVTYYGPTADMRPEMWDAILDVNLRAPVRLTSMLLPTLLARPEAHVLNVCSALGLIAMPRVAAYCTSKFGLVGYSEALRAECGRLGLGVTALCPGFVSTNLFANALRPPSKSYAKSPPSWLCTTPERVARAAVKSVRRNRGLVIVEPVARAMLAAKRFAPGLLDLLQSLGRRKRMAAKELTWKPVVDQPPQPPAVEPTRRAA